MRISSSLSWQVFLPVVRNVGELGELGDGITRYLFLLLLNGHSNGCTLRSFCLLFDLPWIQQTALSK